MKKILFAVDGTKSCQKAAEFVVKFFGDREDCAFTIIHVKTPIMLYGEAALAAYEDVNQYCPARPHALNVSVDWDKQWCGWYGSNISLTGRVLSAVDYTGMMLDAPFTEYEIHNPAYTIWKVQLTNRFRDGLRLNIAVDNIFNYAPRTYYFNSPVTLGVNLMVGVSVDLDKWL